MEGKERDEGAKTDNEEERNAALGLGRDGGAEQFVKAEAGGSAGCDKPEQSGQEDNRSEGQVDGDLPGDLPAFTPAQDSDHEEGGYEGEFMEGVEEKEVGGNEGAHRARGDKEDGNVPESG